MSALPGLQVGSVVAGYELLDTVGSGGNATVFRARSDAHPIAAVKVLHPHSIGTDEARRFTREFRALNSFDHPCIVRVFDAGVEHGYPWIAMEYVEGRDLSDEVARWEADPPSDRWARVERILRGLCAALDHIHSRGFIHRDLKPANVLLDERGEPRLSDFGVVKSHRANTTNLTMQGNLVGTIAFMAPEQITDEAVDARTDLYSLGALLYVLLTGRKPIEADSITGFLARHLTHVPPAPSSIHPDVPRRLEVICQRLLYKERSQRYPTARAVLAALDDVEAPDASPLRGRDQLLTAARERLADLRDGVGGVLCLHGPSGSGRTAALNAIERLARESGVSLARTDASARNPIGVLLEALDPSAADRPTSQHLRALADAARRAPTALLVDDLDHLNENMRTALARLVHKLVTVEVEPLLLVFTALPDSPAAQPLVDGDATGLPAQSLALAGLTRNALVLALRDRGLRGTTAAALSRRFLDELDALPGAVDQQIGTLEQEGWLRRRDGRLIAQLPLSELTRRPLPVPRRMADALRARLHRLDPEALGAAETLAVIGRPATASLLAACTAAGGSACDRLIDAGLCRWIAPEPDAEPALTFALPWLSATLFAEVGAVRRKGMHGEIAEALSQHHPPGPISEQARHYEAAGQPAAAYPLLIRAARTAARDLRPAAVLKLAEHALRLAPAAERALDATIAIDLRRRLRQLQGQAYLERGAWAEAQQPLEEALSAARLQGHAEAVGRAASGLGRSLYRQGDLKGAQALLSEALEHASPISAEGEAARRTLADVHLKVNDLPAAESLWRDASRHARTPDARARAYRGLAHLRVLQGRLPEASAELDRADTLLQSGGAPHVRAGILARAVELDLAAARYATAERRAARLLDLAERAELDSRMAEAWITTLEVLVHTGRTDGVERAIEHASSTLRAEPPHAGLLRLRLARCLARLGRDGPALGALPDPLTLEPDAIEDPGAQHAALRARASAGRHPDRAAELATWCLRRVPPRLILRAVVVALDAGHALGRAGHTASARAAAKRGLAAMEGEGYDGLRLDLLALFAQVDPDPRVRDTLDRVLDRVRADQPPEIAEALAQRFDGAP